MNFEHSSKDLKEMKEGGVSIDLYHLIKGKWYTFRSKHSLLFQMFFLIIFLFPSLITLCSSALLLYSYFLSLFLTFFSFFSSLDFFPFLIPFFFFFMKSHFFYKLKQNQEVIKPPKISMMVFQRQVVMEDSTLICIFYNLPCKL